MIWLRDCHSLKSDAGIIQTICLSMGRAALNSCRLICVLLVLLVHGRDLKVKARSAPGIDQFLMLCQHLLLIVLMHRAH